MPLELQNRDLEIFKFVFENRIATYQQIYRRFFYGKVKSLVSRRLCKLTDVGYFNQSCLRDKNKVHICFHPNEKLFQEIRRCYNFYIDQPHFKTESPFHDISLIEIRQRLENLVSFKNYFSENLLDSSLELQNEFQLNKNLNLHPDGILHLVNPQGSELVCAIEYEGSRKSLKRYTEKITKYYKLHLLHYVLYICKNKSIQKLVEEANYLNNPMSDAFVLTALEKDVFNDKAQIIFSSRGEQILNLSLNQNHVLHPPQNRPVNGLQPDSS